MVTSRSVIIIASALVAGCALYIALRWRRSPQAYRALMVLATCYFNAGSLAGPHSGFRKGLSSVGMVGDSGGHTPISPKKIALADLPELPRKHHGTRSRTE